MTKFSEPTPGLCYCGSGSSYRDCCGPIVKGERPAASAEQLMRARYSAYVTENSDFLLASWHPRTRPDSLRLRGAGIRWTGLVLCGCQAGGPGDVTGRVEFIAQYEQGGVPGEVHEDSRFVFEQDRWFYVDGNLKAGKKVGRNDPCPCGSGKKYKKCCG